MQAVPDYRPLHASRWTRPATCWLGILPADLARSTPCAGWDLSTLLRHMIGQNHGFADAVEFGDAPLEAFAHRGFPPRRPAGRLAGSADRLRTAFASAPLDRLVKLAEIRPDEWFPVAIAVGFQLLDTVIHTWDVATALGAVFRPDEEMVEATLAQARRVPNAPTVRERPGAAFDPVLP